ncbi:MAG: response regulator [Dehalococcoidia bacterium]|nr:response regulator [Dehalococcoidia bacterium]
MAGTILVVDDDDPVRVMLARLLRTQGYTVLQAAHASEARAQIDLQKPDLVISDIVMPGESGIELRRNILERWPGLPVILISGYSAEGPGRVRRPNAEHRLCAEAIRRGPVPRPGRSDAGKCRWKLVPIGPSE